VDDTMLRDWWILILRGRTMIGRAHGTYVPDGEPMRTEASGLRPTILGPVYDLNSGIQLVKQPNGQAGIARTCVAMPVLGLLSIEEIEVPESAIVISCAMRSGEDRKLLAKAIQIAEEITSSLRAEASGIVLAPAGTK
jgi:hypothetical protein